jgi:hypothetical protein
MEIGMNRQTIGKYQRLETKLKREYPRSFEDAEELSASITDPNIADPKEIWAQMWGKPLFANTRVELGQKNRSQLQPYAKDLDAWGDPKGAIRFKRIGKGYATESFSEVTRLAREIRSKTGIAMHRLFAIQVAARALYRRAETSKTPYADLIDLPLRERVSSLKKEMEFGWGHITILHFLTDLGLACKPDRHLVRTVRYLQGLPEDNGQGAVTLEEAISANTFAAELIKELDGTVTPKRLRFFDKILMEISRQRLIPSASAHN